ncbi:MAG TPA: alpha/beta fold hydrolase [Gemmatimonadaceae bacterium]|nr:alpha/beta fold hydrolase [Gemmatimonadaceae bacterium]
MRDVRLATGLTAGLALVALALATRRRALLRHAPPDIATAAGADDVRPGAEPIDLPAPPGARDDRAALLLHGFGDTPQSLAYLAGYLQAAGWAVRVPLLPGHGRTVRRFAASCADDWIAHARGELTDLRRRHARVALVGQSMGGALAAILAAERPAPDAVVLLAPYLAMPARLRHLSRMQALWSPVLPFLASGGERSILDDAERARSLAYGVVSGRLLAELRAVVERAAAALPAVTSPTLVVQSRRDHRIAPVACERAVARLGARRTRLVWLDEGGHVLAVDRGRERVFALVAAWLDAELARARPAREVAAAGGRGII